MKSYSLYPFQKQAVLFIEKNRGRALLADDMGLGKTIEALSYVSRHPEIQKILVIAPANVTMKWQVEIGKWLDRPSQVVFTGKDKLTEPILVMSYDMMRSRYKELGERDWDIIIFDESHYLKTYNAQRTKVAQKLKSRALRILCLTGTPVLNKPMELFQQLNIIDPKTWHNPFAYGRRYCWDGIRFEGATNLEELRGRLTYIMIRRTKEEVKDQLPNLQRTMLPFKLSNMKEYREIEQGVVEALKELNPDHKGYHFGILDRLNDLRQYVGLAKVPIAVSWAQDFLEGDRKLVIYAHHKEVVKRIQEALGGQVITGDTPQKARGEIIKAFQNDCLPRIVTITNAGGEGIDLFGIADVKSSDIMVVERDWTPAKEEQAEARLHRIGQKNAVNAWYLVAEKTIDDRMNRLIEKKRGVIGGMMALYGVETSIVEDLMKEYIGG